MLKAVFKINPVFSVLLIAAALLCIALVSPVQAAVVIQSQPQSVVAAEGNTAVFTVRATSNRTLRYYWYRNGVMLSTKTTALAITVSAATVGTYHCLVSDGDTKARCAEFTVAIGTAEPVPPVASACNCACSGAAKLSWDKPTIRADNALLPPDQIAGYDLYHSATSATTLVKKGERISGAAISYTVTGLLPGTHYFALRTIDTAGLASRRSRWFFRWW